MSCESCIDYFLQSVRDTDTEIKVLQMDNHLCNYHFKISSMQSAGNWNNPIQAAKCKIFSLSTTNITCFTFESFPVVNGSPSKQFLYTMDFQEDLIVQVGYQECMAKCSIFESVLEGELYRSITFHILHPLVVCMHMKPICSTDPINTDATTKKNINSCEVSPRRVSPPNTQVVSEIENKQIEKSEIKNPDERHCSVSDFLIEENDIFILADQQLWKMNVNLYWSKIMDCPKTFNLFLCKNYFFRVYAKRTIQKLIGSEWMDWVHVNDTNEFSTAVFQDKLFVVGGLVGDARKRILEIDADQPIFRCVADMKHGRGAAILQVFQNRLYVLGGIFGEGPYGSCCDVESFDGHVWQTHANLPNPNFCFATAATENHLFVLGGIAFRDNRTDGGKLSAVYRYDPLINVWELFTRMPDQYSHFSACVSSNRLCTFSNTNAESKPILQIFDFEKHQWFKHTYLPISYINKVVIAV